MYIPHSLINQIYIEVNIPTEQLNIVMQKLNKRTCTSSLKFSNSLKNQNRVSQTVV